MFKLEYDKKKRILSKVADTGESEILTDDFPSEPIYSPNKKYAAFIYPLEWECLGSLYLFNTATGSMEKLIPPDDNHNIPKFTIWLNDQTLAIIIGEGYGTVSLGGNVFTYNIKSNNLRQETLFTPDIQITKLILKDDYLILKGIKYKNDTFNSEEYKNLLPIKKLIT